jgi:hypothetical protein
VREAVRARWSAVESVQKTAPKVAVFCHLFNHRYIDNIGFPALKVLC